MKLSDTSISTLLQVHQRVIDVLEMNIVTFHFFDTNQAKLTYSFFSVICVKVSLACPVKALICFAP